MQDPDPGFSPLPGVAETLRPGLRRILAPNASPMTYRGTNTYLLGTRNLAVIDPGPQDERHLAAILAALTPAQQISHILVTHAHIDHSPLARDLSAATGAAVLAYGDAQAGRSAVMERLSRDGLAGGGEGVDAAFAPDQCLRDGARVIGDEWEVIAHHTPGHFGNHLCFEWEDALFSGDLVMGWATSLVSPPDGDLTDFMASCAAMHARAPAVLYPGHGREVTEAMTRISALIAHRNGREAEILAALSDGGATADALARRIYRDTPAALMGAATRNVFAHLVDLYGKNRVTAEPELSSSAIFSRV